MILIFSTASNDETTNRIMDWLYHFEANFLRINGEDIFDQMIPISNQELIDKTNVVWFRRSKNLVNHMLKFTNSNREFVEKINTFNI